MLTVQTYGYSSPELSEWTRQHQTEVQNALAAEVPGHDALVRAVRIPAPLGDCEHQPGQPATDEVSWHRYDHGERIDHLVICCRDCLSAVLADAMSGGTADRPRVEAGLLQRTMRVGVHVPAEDRRYSDFVLPTVRALTVAVHCPECGALRGRPTLRRAQVHGSTINVHRWVNPCGHPETVDALVAEDAALTAAPVAA